MVTMLAPEHDPVRSVWAAQQRAQRAGSDHPDWQQRPLSQMTSQIWQGDDDDHGAMTRFGMGWGPIEVVRAHRFVKNDKGPKVYRTMEIYGGGALRLTITFSPTGRAFTVTDARTRSNMVPTGAPPPDITDETEADEAPDIKAAVLALSNVVYASKVQLPPEVWAALDAVEKAAG